MVTKQRSTVGRPSRMKIHCQPSRGVCLGFLWSCVSVSVRGFSGGYSDMEHKTERKKWEPRRKGSGMRKRKDKKSPRRKN